MNVYNSSIVANIVAFVIQTATGLTARVLLQACYIQYAVCAFLPQYMGKVEPWCKACGEGELPSELQDLEDTIHHHQGLYEHITTAYSEVSTHIHTHCREKKVGNTIVLISTRIIFAFT